MVAVGPEPRKAADDGGLIVRVGDGSDPVQARVTLSGELDFCTAPTLARTLGRVVRPSDRVVAIDTRGLAFCDGAGLRLLLGLHTRMARRGGSLVLYGPSPSLQRILAALGPRGGLPLSLSSAPVDRPPDHLQWPKAV